MGPHFRPARFSVSKSLALIAALLLPAAALAQDSQKFNAKALEKSFPKLAVFTVKGGGVVDNEVIVTKGKTQNQAVYVIKSDSSKVVDFYKSKLGVDPAVTGEEALGDVKYTFAIRPKKGDIKIYKLTVVPLEGGGKVQIALFERDATEEDNVPEE